MAYRERDLSESSHRELARTLELAEDLNATLKMLEAADEVMTLAAYVKEAGMNHLVLSHRPRTGIRRVLGTSLADRILAVAPTVSVHLVSEG